MLMKSGSLLTNRIEKEEVNKMISGEHKNYKNVPRFFARF